MSEQFSAILHEAARLNQRGDREQAAQLCRNVLYQQPDYLPALLWLAYTSANHQEAETCINKAYQLAPQDATVREVVSWYNSHFVDPAGGAAPSPTTSDPAEQTGADLVGWQTPIAEPVKDSPNFFTGQAASLFFGSLVVLVVSGVLVLASSGFIFTDEAHRAIALRRYGYTISILLPIFLIALGFVVFSLLDSVLPPTRATGFIADRRAMRSECYDYKHDQMVYSDYQLQTLLF